MRGKQYNETYKVRLGEMRRGIIHEWLPESAEDAFKIYFGNAVKHRVCRLSNVCHLV